MDKKELRSKYKLIRKSIIDKKKKSNDIVSLVLGMKEYLDASTIALYYPLEDEVDVIPLIQKSLKDNKIVLLPKVISNQDMIFVKINSLDEVELSTHFNIYEPLSNEEYKDSIDLMVVPSICASLSGYRIGYGKGYYDRYLVKHDVKNKVGICFKECVINDDSFTSKYDIKMNRIIFK